MQAEAVGDDTRLVCDKCGGQDLLPTRPVVRWTGLDTSATSDLNSDQTESRDVTEIKYSATLKGGRYKITSIGSESSDDEQEGDTVKFVSPEDQKKLMKE